MLDTLAMAGQLTGEYKKVFETADMYSMGNGSSTKGRDERLMDLYDILMEAQKEGKSVEKIVGDDMEKFCKEFFAEEKNYFGEILIKGYNIARVVFGFSILEFFLAEEGDIWNMQANIFPFILGLMIGCIVTVFYKFVLQPIIFKNRKINPTIHSWIIIGVFIAAFIGSICLGVFWADAELYVNNIAVLLISGGYILLYLLVRSVWRIRTYGRAFGIHKEEKQLEKEFNEEIDRKETLQINAQVLAKEFAKKNAKNRRKGKSEYTQQEFAEMIRKQQSRSKKGNIVLMMAIVVVPCIFEMVINDIVEGLIYGAITAVIEFFIWRFFSRFAEEAANAQLYILEECEKQGMNVIEYKKSIEK
ncbi:MAG: DUF1048 domain-containing protein [Lachnospiraceae bacterium]|nr:DUF1048 domain-containing protein [Lachnospiraceae bacterium]